MKGSKPAKDLYACWDCNNHGGRGEVSPSVNIHPYGKHVVSSDDEAQETDGDHGSDHTHVPERLLLA